MIEYINYSKNIYMSKSLDIDAVRCFVLTADLSSFTRAAEVLDIAQAAISLKIKRLEKQLGFRVLDRTPRLVVLSKEGHGFIDAARALLVAHDHALNGEGSLPRRRLSIGISDHVAAPDLPIVLKKLYDHDPTMSIEVKVAASRFLSDDFERGKFDAVIVRNEDRVSGGSVLFTDKVSWFASPSFKHQMRTPLALITLAESCGMRKTSIEALDKAKIEWREVFIGGGILAVRAAASAGLGVVSLATRIAPPGTIDVSRKLNLPLLPQSEVVAKIRSVDRSSHAAIKTLIAAFRRF